jgi:CBS domain containing-hemolysin-like protein
MMTLAGIVLAAVLLLVSFVQLLSLESMRLRPTESAALEYFKEHLEQRLGADTERGTLAYSMAKHTLLVACGAFFAARAGADAATAARDFAAAWFVMLGCCYVGAHWLFRRTDGHWAEPLVPVLRAIVLPFRPLTALFEFLERLSAIGAPNHADDKEPSVSEELEMLTTAGEDEGIIEEADSKLIHSVVAFGDKRVREVMTPRPRVAWIDVSRPLEELRELVNREQYSRIPIGEGSIDHLIGFVHVRDLYALDDEQRATRTIRELMRDIEGVPETKLVAELLREMQNDGRHIVYVVTEYGDVSGIATLEDLVEEVFGEIFDEHEGAREIQRAEDGSITVEGSYDVDHLREEFHFEADEESESATVGGLVTEWLGAVPEVGAVVERDGIRIEVLAADQTRVERVRIRAVSPRQERES